MWLYFSQPFLEKRLKLQDTCGIHNLHAVPGMLGGFVGAIVAAAATEEVYGKEGWVTNANTHKTWNSKTDQTCLLTTSRDPHAQLFSVLFWKTHINYAVTFELSTSVMISAVSINLTKMTLTENCRVNAVIF